MSDFLSFLSEIFNSQIIIVLKDLAKKEATEGNILLLDNPTSAIFKQLILLAICWAALKYIGSEIDEIDWQSVSSFISKLTRSFKSCLKQKSTSKLIVTTKFESCNNWKTGHLGVNPIKQNLAWITININIDVIYAKKFV